MIISLQRKLATLQSDFWSVIPGFYKMNEAKKVYEEAGAECNFCKLPGGGKRRGPDVAFS